MNLRTLLLAALLSSGAAAFAQTADPVIMTINGKPVLRSEFEYSYNKNNTDGVIDKKTVKEYVDLFINYKLKVLAAEDAHLDTLRSFQNEFATYRDQQIRPALIDSTDVEAEALRIYQETQQRIDGNGGLRKPAHILVQVGQKEPAEAMEKAHARIDSIYQALRAGADFIELATKLSQDNGSAVKFGELPWITKGQTYKEFEDVTWSLKKGEFSKPFSSPAGWHIVLLKDSSNFFTYESQREEILRFIDQRGLRERIIDNKLKVLAEKQVTTPDEIIRAKREEMIAADPELKNLIREYHDGLLLYEISNRLVWSKASKDSVALVKYFNKNKKKYKWDAPRFKGIAYHARKVEDLQAVKDALKGLPFDKWADKLRITFNSDSVLRIRVEKGIFRKGNSALVDKEIFGVDTVAKPKKDFPYSAVYGKRIAKPEQMEDVKALVIADYQEQLEKEWVAALRKKYPFTVDEQVLETVNKH